MKYWLMSGACVAVVGCGNGNRCQTVGQQFDAARLCYEMQEVVPVCFSGPTNTKGIAFYCAISPDGNFYLVGAGSHQTPRGAPGWRFRVDGTQLSAQELMSCDALDRARPSVLCGHVLDASIVQPPDQF